MNKADLVFASAAELSPLIKKREVSPVELVEAFLDRIALLNDSLKAFIHVNTEEALQSARNLEGELSKGHWRGPLHGIPVAYKDIIDVAGLPTTAASKVMDGYRADEDATVAARLRDAGAICLGKLNLLEFASGSMEVFGAARNPWNLNYSPGGGSSTGSAVAVAGGLVTLALGTDTGGSIRGPAAGCGIPGLKPTYGRVSRAGVIPLSWSLDHVGPMARSVDDLALMLQVIAGPDPRDSTASTVPVPDYSSSTLRQLRRLRIGLPKQFFFEGCDDEVLQVLEQVSSGLRDLGHDTVEINLPNADLGPAASWAMAYSEAFAYHRKNFLERSGDYTGAFLWKITAAGMLSAEERIIAQRIQQAVTDDFVSALTEVDAIIVPVVRRAPAKLGASPAQRGDDTRSTTRPISLTGLPTLVLPCGFSRAGMPLAFQLVSRSWDEETLFMIGRSWETVHDWRKSRPSCAALDDPTDEKSAQIAPPSVADGPAPISGDWIMQAAQLLGLNYVSENEADQLASMLAPVKTHLAIARDRLDPQLEPAVRPAPEAHS
jgi:aspartyl-tRNA(Asn)/glutamyl-tRNA(Gln) amidotransferase subunit A